MIAVPKAPPSDLVAGASGSTPPAIAILATFSGQTLGLRIRHG
jgi:hypothetical protein